MLTKPEARKAQCPPRCCGLGRAQWRVWEENPRRKKQQIEKQAGLGLRALMGKGHLFLLGGDERAESSRLQGPDPGGEGTKVPAGVAAQSGTVGAGLRELLGLFCRTECPRAGREAVALAWSSAGTDRCRRKLLVPLIGAWVMSPLALLWAGAPRRGHELLPLLPVPPLTPGTH